MPPSTNHILLVSSILLIIVVGNTFVPLLFCEMEHKRYLCGVQLIIVLLHDVIIDVQIVNYSLIKKRHQS